MKHRFLKRISFLLACLTIALSKFFIFSPQTVFATEQLSTILIINQVRGMECCEVGSSQNLQHQLQTLLKLDLPGTFAFRYDALLDDSFTDQLKKQSPFEAALFLEITPRLAQKAEVPYKGPPGRWYKANNAYLIGYTQAERQKIIDVLFAQFKAVFGEYPHTTVGWMVDPWSLRYMSDTYHITAHEITREQWGTDSYTLYGGPINDPYLPSKNWALIPGSDIESSLPVVIFRQTITDPVWTYGDTTSTRTSQPNDYLRANLPTTYFADLLSSALNQKPFGFGVIGLENSMTDQYQQEFDHQLTIVNEFKQTKDFSVKTATEFAQQFLKKPFSPKALSVFSRSDSLKNIPIQAWWIGTSSYRVRLIKKGNEFWITDVRLYSDQFTDPFINTSTSGANAYWVIPFWYDASRYHQLIPDSFATKIGQAVQKIKTFITGKETPRSLPTDVLNDFLVLPSGIRLPNAETQPVVTYSDQELKIKYETSEHKSITLLFQDDKFSLIGDMVLPKYEEIIASSELSELHLQKEFSLQTTTQENTVTFQPVIHASAAGSLQKQPSRQFSPESDLKHVQLQNSAIIYTNQYALAGRNPIRVVFRFRDQDGHPTLPKDTIQLLFPEKKTPTVVIQEPESADGEYYVDLESSSAMDFQPELLVDGQKMKLRQLHFVTNCKNEKLKCINKPGQLFQFLITKIDDAFHRRK